MATKRVLPAAKRAFAKSLIGTTRRRLGLTVEELAAAVGLRAHTLQEYERPGGPCPSRPTFADLGIALHSAEMLALMMPPGWLVLSPGQVELVRDALAAVGILPG
jgi:transcriptional regulator with XRE-family HTH domain